MIWILSLVLSAHYGMAQTRALDPYAAPAEWTAGEQQAWAESNCRLRLIDHPSIATHTYGRDITPDRNQCFAFMRLMLIGMESRGLATPANRRLFREDAYAIYESASGQREVCYFVSVKDTYDRITMAEYISAFREGKDAFAELIEKIDENINLRCLLM